MNANVEKKDNERGAASIIEMTLIFPLVLVTVVTLFLMAIYILHSITAFSAAQTIAVAAAREIQMPGYTDLYGNGGVTSKPDFNWASDYVPGKGTVDGIMKNHDPYRYWSFSGGLLRSDAKTTLESGFRTLWAGSGFLSGGAATCEITVQNAVLAQYVNVHVKQTVKLPGFVKMIGVDPNLDMDVYARAVVSDCGEFVRNTDMVFDLGEYLWKELKFGSDNKSLSERVGIFGQKIKDAKAKLGWN